MTRIRSPKPVDDLAGVRVSRSSAIGGLPDERLVIRHDAGT